MVELELLGLHSDGEHLTLTGPNGQQYRLLVDDALRAAVRRDRAQLEQLRAAGTSPLRPKDIQARIRAGASAADVAEEAGLPVEHVRRYEGPVLAERTWVVEQARRFAIGRSEGAPELGDLVVDRLAARGVTTGDLEWDAVRSAGKSWEVLVRFVAGDRRREARWEADLTSRAVHALDDESRWLSETDLSTPPSAARRHLVPVPVRLYAPEPETDLGPAIAAVDATLHLGGDPQPVEEDPTEGLLAELSASRGTRQELDLGIEDDILGALDLPPAAHPPASRAEHAGDAHVLSLPPRGPDRPVRPETPRPEEHAPAEEPAERRAEAPAPTAEDPAGQPEQAPRRARTKGRRTSVPSWDEIVFGAKPE
ncbi:septation protein SepH [Georgenia faecalis]|uniref:Septation protein SepH n=1 Tax=Georgenia faecalis TaxID=2483799 RepID=A0ABV9DCB6_9MICO|nr:septation protein SepH [Georgenia faecalis]